MSDFPCSLVCLNCEATSSLIHCNYSKFHKICLSCSDNISLNNQLNCKFCWSPVKVVYPKIQEEKQKLSRQPIILNKTPQKDPISKESYNTQALPNSQISFTSPPYIPAKIDSNQFLYKDKVVIEESHKIPQIDDTEKYKIPQMIPNNIPAKESSPKSYHLSPSIQGEDKIPTKGNLIGMPKKDKDKVVIEESHKIPQIDDTEKYKIPQVLPNNIPAKESNPKSYHLSLSIQEEEKIPMKGNLIGMPILYKDKLVIDDSPIIPQKDYTKEYKTPQMVSNNIPAKVSNPTSYQLSPFIEEEYKIPTEGNLIGMPKKDKILPGNSVFKECCQKCGFEVNSEKICTRCKPRKCESCNEHKEINIGNQFCQHYLCKDCSIKKCCCKCDPNNTCKYCKKPSIYLKPFCNHNICETCRKSKPCPSCKCIVCNINSINLIEKKCGHYLCVTHNSDKFTCDECKNFIFCCRDHNETYFVTDYEKRKGFIHFICCKIDVCLKCRLSKHCKCGNPAKSLTINAIKSTKSAANKASSNTPKINKNITTRFNKKTK